jgi:hypothetical protein
MPVSSSACPSAQSALIHPGDLDALASFGFLSGTAAAWLTRQPSREEVLLTFNEASWEVIEGLRAKVAAFGHAPSLADAASGFTQLFRSNFESVVLARAFVVLPYSQLPSKEQKLVTRDASIQSRLRPDTPVLSLLASHGKEPAWNGREGSQGHRAIPLLDSASVSEAPMIAKLLADLEVDLKALDDGRPIATRQMLGGRNGTFYVPDAVNARDQRGRHIIPARDFTEQYGIRTVFGMGGAYMDGTLTVAILFCSEALDRMVVDRFPSFISSFKMATAPLVRQGNVFGPSQS